MIAPRLGPPTHRWSLGLGLAGWVLAVSTVAPVHPARASVTGLVPARTGGFGEMTCQQCHWENPLDEPAGRLTITGIPQSYTPGEQYSITVTLVRPGLARAGFQLSAREDGINMNAGSDAGVLSADDPAVERVYDQRTRVTFVQHSPSGTIPGADAAATWTFTWTAPEQDQPVVFHAAANAANGDDSPLGDYIYTATTRSR